MPTLLPYERWKEAHPADISDHSKNFVCRIYLSHYFYLELPLIFVPLSMHICIFPLYQTRSLYVCSMPIRMKHVSMMHACVMHVKNGDGRTNGKLNSRSRIKNLLKILFYKNPTSVSESFPLWRSFHFLCTHNSHPVVLGFSIFCDFTETSCSCSSFISSLSTRAPRVELTSKFSSDDIGCASFFP